MPNTIIFIVVIVALLNVIAQTPKRTKAQPEPNRTKPIKTNVYIANMELIDALYSTIESMEQQREKLLQNVKRLKHFIQEHENRQNYTLSPQRKRQYITSVEKAKRQREQSKKQIDRLTEQIARKKVQIAKLESKVNR